MIQDVLLDCTFYNAESDSEAVRALYAFHERCKSYNDSRRDRIVPYAGLYEGLSLTSLSSYAYSTDSGFFFKDGSIDIPLIRNTAHGIIDAFVSTIGAQDNPKPTFLTTEGNWDDKRKAEKMRKLVEASYKEQQGKHVNTYKLCEHGLRMAGSCTGTVAIKVCVYPGETKIVHELHDTLSMGFDMSEASYQERLTLSTLTYLDPDRVKSMYPGNDEIINTIAVVPPHDMKGTIVNGRLKKMVPLYEGWRVSVGGTKGKYVCGLSDGTCFANDIYDYPTPPFAFFTIDPELWGPYGHSITHFIFESVRRDNMILATIDRSVMRTNKSKTYVFENSLSNEDDLERTDEAQIIKLKTGAQPPVDVSAPGFHQNHLQLAEQHRRDTFDLSGIPESRAGAKADPSISSAIGQRNIAAMVNKRFAAAQTSYIQWVAVDIAHLDIRAMKEVYDRDGVFTKRWYGKKFFQEIDGSVLDLDEDKYTITGEAVSGLKNTPAARVQQADEFYKSGAISADTYALATEDYDTPDIIQDENADAEWLNNQMWKWAYADDSETLEPGFYEGPVSFSDLGLLLSVVMQGFSQARVDKLPDERLNYFLMFMSDLDALITQRAQNQARLQAAAQTPPAPQLQVSNPNAPSPALGINREAVL